MFVLPLQKWLHERVLMFHYANIARLVAFNEGKWATTKSTCTSFFLLTMQFCK